MELNILLSLGLHVRILILTKKKKEKRKGNWQYKKIDKHYQGLENKMTSKNMSLRFTEKKNE